MDYKKLLAKYVAHVVNEEGIDFINRIEPNKSTFGSLPIFSEEEKKILKDISSEDVQKYLDLA